MLRGFESLVGIMQAFVRPGPWYGDGEVPVLLQQGLDHVAAGKFSSYSTRGFHENGANRTPQGGVSSAPYLSWCNGKTEAFVTINFSMRYESEQQNGMGWNWLAPR